MRSTLAAWLAAACLVMAAAVTAPARAELAEITLGQQFGAIFIPLMAMENMKLIEKHGAAQGLPELKTNWVRLAGPSALVDGIISGTVHFSAQGVPSLAIMWEKTKGGVGVKAAGAITNSDLYLNTRNPGITSIKDFTEKDRIALPSVRSTTQAILLQIAAEKEWGQGQHGRLDHLTVGLAHPDALASVLNPQSEINTHFASSPFHEAEMKAGMRTITSAYKIMGGATTNLVFVTTDKFRSDNPKLYAATLAALDEAIAWTNADKRRAARLYIEMTKEKKLSEDEIVAIISGEGFDFSTTPKKVGALAQFMAKIGSLKSKPATWKDMFFPEAHGLQGD